MGYGKPIPDPSPADAAIPSLSLLRILEIVVLLLIVVVLLILFAPMRPWFIGDGPLPCPSRLKQIGVALHVYHEVYGTFPPAHVLDASGKPIHSWRVLLLPYLDQEELFRQYHMDEPWDGPHNSRLHDRVVEIFHCPDTAIKPASRHNPQTNFVAVVGPRTAFPGDKCVALSDITDDHGNTILVVEVANSGIHWMEPRDLHVTQMARTINPARGQGISSPHRGGANVLMADSSVRFLREDEATAESVRSLLTIDDGEP